MTPARHTSIPFVVAASAAFASCVSDQQLRGTDRGALLPAVRAQWALTEPRPPANARRVTFLPTLAAEATCLDGEFATTTGRADYAVTAVHGAFAPLLTWRDVQCMPLAGLGYSRIDVDDATEGFVADGPGVLLGAQLAWRGWSPLEPYVRYTSLAGVDTGVRRFEAGVDCRIAGPFGCQLAYARQTSEADELEDVFLTTVVDSVRIESEGLHLAMSLRF